jgi:predicted molibdopterin-dependent oxidoreductase YjgC
MGANPTDGHPVFGSQMKRRLRQGAKLIVADPRAIGSRTTYASRSTTSAPHASRGSGSCGCGA